MPPEIDVTGLEPAAVLAALYNAALPQGRGAHQALTQADAAAFLAQTPPDEGADRHPRWHIDYLRGRPIKAWIGGPCLDPWAYDGDNGSGAAARAIAALRAPTTPHAWDDHWQGTVLGADDTHRYLWLWQGFNIRLVAVPHGEATSYDHGWCYPRDPSAVHAAFASWDPATQDEPAGWHKRPTHPPRRAPHRDLAPDYNRLRCVHGCYVDDGCRTVACLDSGRANHKAAQEDS